MSQANALIVALIIVLVAVLAGAVLVRGSGRGGGERRKGGREGYLIYPYLDLDEPGERGSYYALSENP